MVFLFCWLQNFNPCREFTPRVKTVQCKYYFYYGNSVSQAAYRCQNFEYIWKIYVSFPIAL